MTSMITKECNECHRDLNLFEYGFSPSRGVHNSKCKECTKKRRKKWYTKDPAISYSVWDNKKNKLRREGNCS